MTFHNTFLDALTSELWRTHGEYGRKLDSYIFLPTLGTFLFRKDVLCHRICMFSVSPRGVFFDFSQRRIDGGCLSFLVLGARDPFQLQIRRFRSLAKIDTLRQSKIPFLQKPFAYAGILDAENDPVTNDRITHAVTKIRCFRQCAKDGDIHINAFVFLLISGVESVPFEGFVQLCYGEFLEILYCLRQVIFVVWTAELKAVVDLQRIDTDPVEKQYDSRFSPVAQKRPNFTVLP